MSDAVAAAPTSGHELLLGLAGWVDDDLLAIGRELVAVGEEAGALELLVASLAAARTVLPHPVRAGLADAVERRIGADLARLLPPGAPLPDRTAHAFAPDAGTAETAEQIDEIVDGLTVVARSGARMALTWRTTPAGAAPGPLPHPVVLLVLDDPAPAEVLAYQVGAALARSGVPASVEAFVEGSALPPYQRAALAAARPPGLGSTGPATVSDPDSSWTQEASRSWETGYTEDSDTTVTAAPTVATVSGPYDSLPEHGTPDDRAESAAAQSSDELNGDPLSGNGSATPSHGSRRADAARDGAGDGGDTPGSEDRAKDLVGSTDPGGPEWTGEPAGGPGADAHPADGPAVDDTARTPRQPAERAGADPGPNGTYAGGAPIVAAGPDPARFDPARNAVDRNVHGGPGVTGRPAAGSDLADEQTGSSDGDGTSATGATASTRPPAPPAPADQPGPQRPDVHPGPAAEQGPVAGANGHPAPRPAPRRTPRPGPGPEPSPYGEQASATPAPEPPVNGHGPAAPRAGEQEWARQWSSGSWSMPATPPAGSDPDIEPATSPTPTTPPLSRVPPTPTPTRRASADGGAPIEAEPDGRQASAETRRRHRLDAAEAGPPATTAPAEPEDVLDSRLTPNEQELLRRLQQELAARERGSADQPSSRNGIPHPPEQD